MADFLFRISQPGEREGERGGAYAARKIFRKFSENFEYFFGLLKGRGREGGLAQGATHANKILDNF